MVLTRSIVLALLIILAWHNARGGEPTAEQRDDDAAREFRRALKIDPG